MRYLGVAAIVLAALLIAPAVAQQQQDRAPARAPSTVLSVNAQGMVEGRPDMATITAGVETRGDTAQAALEENARRMTALVQTLRGAGIAERDVQTAYVQLNPRYERRNDRGEAVIVGYNASNTVRARIRTIANTGRVIDAVVASGGNVVQGVSFSYQDPQAQLDRARRDAIRVARERADLYANALGMRVERVISVSEAGAAAPQQSDGEEIVVTGSLRSASVPTPVAPGELQTWAYVSVSFVLR